MFKHSEWRVIYRKDEDRLKTKSEIIKRRTGALSNESEQTRTEGRFSEDPFAETDQFNFKKSKSDKKMIETVWEKENEDVFDTNDKFDNKNILSSQQKKEEGAFDFDDNFADFGKSKGGKEKAIWLLRSSPSCTSPSPSCDPRRGFVRSPATSTIRWTSGRGTTRRTRTPSASRPPATRGGTPTPVGTWTSTTPSLRTTTRNRDPRGPNGPRPIWTMTRTPWKTLLPKTLPKEKSRIFFTQLNIQIFC